MLWVLTLIDSETEAVGLVRRNGHFGRGRGGLHTAERLCRGGLCASRCHEDEDDGSKFAHFGYEMVPEGGKKSSASASELL